MIIGISGKMGSGKDTLADMILELDRDFEKKAFAFKLKQIASILTGIPIRDFSDQEFKKTNMPTEWWDAIDDPISVREFLQYLGTDAVREGIHEQAWVNALFADYMVVWNDPDPIPGNDYRVTFQKKLSEELSLIHYGGGSEAEVFNTELVQPKWIITDMRFPNEAEAVRKRGGFLVRINKDIEGRINSDHDSETALDDYPYWDLVIENNGSLGDLHKQAQDIINRMPNHGHK